MRTFALATLALPALALATPLLERQNHGSDNHGGSGYGGKGNAGYKTRSGPPGVKCSTQYYDIDVTSNNTVFTNVESNANETYLTYLLSQFVAQLPATTGNFTEKYTSGKKAKTDTYTLSGTLCTPESGDKDDGAIQLLVHGIGFDSSYWDFNYEDEEQSYSYVEAAAKAGHTTFRYDRLGTGLSEKPADTYNVVQGATDVAILSAFITKLQNGDIGGKKYSKIAGIGHSYGSVQLQAITQARPTALDTVVLTGFSANTTFVPVYLTSTAYSTASIVAPSRFSSSQFTNGYLITLSPWTNQLNFAWFPSVTQGASDRARATEQPVTQGVLFTFGGLPGPAPKYTGNVHVVTGDRDWIFCGLNCISGAPAGFDSIPAAVTQLYPAASSFSTFVPSEVGHGINFHKQAPEVYAETLAYLDRVFY